MFRKELLRQSRAISLSIHRSSVVQRASISSIGRQSRFPQLPSNLASSLGRRWQSTESEKKETPEGEAVAAEPSPEDALKQDLEKKSKEAADFKDKYLRSVADFRNLQDRTKRDMDSARQFAIQRFATDLLDSIDNLDRALGSVPESAIASSSQASSGTTSNTSSADPNTAAASESSSPLNKDLQNLYSGLRMTETILMNTLKKHGIERFDPTEGEGRKFDPNRDEATFFTKVEGRQDGDVFYTQSKGYTLNGRVVRAAKVGVVKNA